MQKESIHLSIDNNIIKSLKEGYAVNSVQKELATKVNNFTNTLLKDPSIDLESLLKIEFEQIYPIRTRYGVTYIKHCLKRIKDLDWVISKRGTFLKLSASQVFKLLKLKEKLSKENSLPF